MTGPTLDEEQTRAVEIDPSARQVVIAGPGSGKTEVVSALAAHLVEEGVALDGELLIISFSNAAVHAVDRRLRAQQMPPATVQTLDSLAAQIIQDVANEDPTPLSFDERVRRATSIVGDEGWYRIDDLRHLIVDEVQDIVGLRADLLLAIIRSLPEEAGFTLLGDLAQGIYDFQLRATDPRGPTSGTTAAQLLARLAADPDVREVILRGQYRARTRETRAAAGLRDAVMTGRGDHHVRAFEASLVNIGALDEAITASLRWSGTTAFLTYTNGQALLVADAISRAGLPVELRRSAQDLSLDGWIACLFADHPAASIDRAAFGELVSALPGDHDARALWRALQAVTRSRGPELDVTHLGSALASSRRREPELTTRSTTGMIVSTIHRAKGLEFDNVVLVEFPPRGEADAAAADEALRVKFVALTRAANRLARCSGPDDRGMSIVPGDPTGRWYRRGRRGGMVAVELRHDDLDPTPAGMPDAQAREMLRNLPPEGLPLELRLDPRASTLHRPVYAVYIDGCTAGRTSEAFGDALARARFSTSGAWPTLEGGFVRHTRTAVASTPTPAAPNGMWLMPAVSGLLRTNWKGD